MSRVFHIDVPDMSACPNFAEAELSEEVLSAVPDLAKRAGEVLVHAFDKLGG